MNLVVEQRFYLFTAYLHRKRRLGHNQPVGSRFYVTVSEISPSRITSLDNSRRPQRGAENETSETRKFDFSRTRH